MFLREAGHGPAGWLACQGVASASPARDAGSLARAVAEGPPQAEGEGEQPVAMPGGTKGTPTASTFFRREPGLYPQPRL